MTAYISASIHDRNSNSHTPVFGVGHWSGHTPMSFPWHRGTATLLWYSQGTVAVALPHSHGNVALPHFNHTSMELWLATLHWHSQSRLRRSLIFRPSKPENQTRPMLKLQNVVIFRGPWPNANKNIGLNWQNHEIGVESS